VKQCYVLKHGWKECDEDEKKGTKTCPNGIHEKTKDKDGCKQKCIMKLKEGEVAPVEPPTIECIWAE